jgi:hypothetical protein
MLTKSSCCLHDPPLMPKSQNGIISKGSGWLVLRTYCFVCPTIIPLPLLSLNLKQFPRPILPFLYSFIPFSPSSCIPFPCLLFFHLTALPSPIS